MKFNKVIVPILILFLYGCTRIAYQEYEVLTKYIVPDSLIQKQRDWVQSSCKNGKQDIINDSWGMQDNHTVYGASLRLFGSKCRVLRHRNNIYSIDDYFDTPEHSLNIEQKKIFYELLAEGKEKDIDPLFILSGLLAAVFISVGCISLIKKMAKRKEEKYEP